MFFHRLIPFIQCDDINIVYIECNVKKEPDLPFRLKHNSVIGHVGFSYESEENYCWFEEHPETELYVKPSNHEARKHKKYRTDISRRENMGYDPETDTYTCAAGKRLTETRQKKTHSASGLELVTSVYECADCAGCPLKEKCIRACGSKKPLEERHKVIYVSKRFA